MARRITEESFLREAEKNRKSRIKAKRREKPDETGGKPDAGMTSIELPARLLPGKRALTPRRLPSYREKMLAFHANHLLPTFFRSLLSGLERNDPQYLKIAADAYGYVQKNNLNIVNTLNQNNQTANVSAGPSVDAVIRQLAEQKKRDRKFITVDVPPQTEGDGPA